MASVVKQFNTLVDSTPNSFVTKRDQFVNDVARENHIMSELMGNYSPKELMQSGPELQDRIYLEQGQRLHTYTPGRKVEVKNPQTHTNHKSHWACFKVDMTWTEAEKEFNVNFGRMSAQGRVDHLKDVLKQKEQDAYTGATEGFDDLSFATPNADTMEHVDEGSSEDATMRSIPSWLNEEPNGLYAGYDLTGTFTKIQNIDPIRYPNWVPGQFSYDNADANFADPNVADNILNVLDKANRRTDFKRPTLPYTQAFDERTPKSKMFVITGEIGYDRVRAAYANTPENFMTIGPRDPSYGEITIGGRRLIEFPHIDEIDLYPHVSEANTLVTAGDASGKRIGGRFYFINGKYVRPFFRKDKFFEKRDVRELDGTVGGYWSPIVLWMQLWIASRRRHAIVYPK